MGIGVLLGRVSVGAQVIRADRMLCNCASVQFGWLAHIWLICSTHASYSLGAGELLAYSLPARSIKAAKFPSVQRLEPQKKTASGRQKLRRL
ncbi:hypothetical protein PS417_15915 [Pseudomonas simiae]|uniref:Uncharacterized protein n=1 Tax=Pseudomonas simiae TaxID=321846 RepID=A0A1N7UJ74_9PSED|nr:hypothetical protein PS417_15915 [Pseudomonas simiae]